MFFEIRKRIQRSQNIHFTLKRRIHLKNNKDITVALTKIRFERF